YRVGYELGGGKVVLCQHDFEGRVGQDVVETARPPFVPELRIVLARKEEGHPIAAADRRPHGDGGDWWQEPDLIEDETNLQLFLARHPLRQESRGALDKERRHLAEGLLVEGRDDDIDRQRL